jgi:hypothetical protein
MIPDRCLLNGRTKSAIPNPPHRWLPQWLKRWPIDTGALA